MITPPIPADSFNRKVDYLRVSVTDRCNLRCIYCMPPEGFRKLRQEEILRYEEVVRLTEIAAGMGIVHVRITGGEPLVRKGITRLCRGIASISGVRSLSLTTNGVLLADFARELAEAGVERINVGLDTLNSETFTAITGRDVLRRVWDGIKAALHAGLHPVKINVVVMRGINDGEIEALAWLTLRYPFHVRFVELMPFQPAEHEKRYVPASEILRSIVRVAPVEEVPGKSGNGPARLYSFAGAPGKIGIISPLSRGFCPSCNRLRLTAEGCLRTCLFSDRETDLRGPLRTGAGNSEIEAIIRTALADKPERHFLSGGFGNRCFGRPMTAVGG